ncbi:DNA binding protein [Propionibacterium phage B3]|uniref:DNA binding protein n=4 Tax=Caudoviricetes TaxID=2731619 RepID=A0A1D8ETD7_9CAUD|nr:transcriptional repressor [Propionibacterium phage B3]AOT24324.1 DNA binding protein [Propionibacterium phage B3]
MAWQAVHMASSDINLEAADMISAAIERSDTSRAEVATLTGIPLTTLRRKLMGRSPVNIEDIFLIAGALGIPPVSITPDVLTSEAAA